jgi:porphobilinogen synthase
MDLASRPRRNRRNPVIRALVRETDLTPDRLVMPCFVLEGEGREEPIASMPGCFRRSIDRLVEAAREWEALGVRTLNLYPVVPPERKDAQASLADSPDSLFQRAVSRLKEALPGVMLATDVALDPYTDHGHDGLLSPDGRILNDQTVEVLCRMSVAQARAGADIVAPSDMMDGRVGAIRSALDSEGFADVLILSYSAKYASAFYGPFRDALSSAPRQGDKKTYQMDPSNRREARREALLDDAEGADMLMVKPALPYLDVLAEVRSVTDLPLCAYHVSGEYAMLKAAARNGWLDYERCLLESLVSIRRAGADFVFTYGAAEAAKLLA